MTTLQLIQGIPLELFQVGTVGILGAAVAANPDGTYTGARATANIFNVSTKTVVIPRDSIVVNCARRHEIVVFQIHTGDVSSVNRALIMSYQRDDADKGTVLKLPQIVLQPGTRLIFDIYNRDPATAADVTIASTMYIIETRIYNQFISQQRAMLEAGVGL